MKKFLAKTPSRHHILKFQKKLYQSLVKYGLISETNLEALQTNENIFDILEFDKKTVKFILEQNGYSYNDCNLSWHYHIFAGWKAYCDKNNTPVINILEIGTHDGRFTYFLSKLFHDANIYTIDLPKNDQQFVNSYNRENCEKLSNFLKIRDENLRLKNTKFIELNSIHILRHFNGMKFDAIWIDGDHHDPQVSIDLANCINLLNPNGIMCNDDVIKSPDHQKDTYVSNESFKTLNHFEKNKVLENWFVFKRIRTSARRFEKYISISKLS